MVVEGVGVALQGLPRPTAGDEHPPDQLRLVAAPRRVQRAVQQGDGVRRGPPPRPLAGQQPRPRRPRPVLDRSRVPAHGLGLGDQQVGGAPVVHRAGRGGRGGVQHLLYEVVRELVGPAGRHQQAGRRGPLAAPGGLVRGHPQQPGDDVRGDGRPEHGTGPQQLLQLGAGPGQPRQHRRLQRLRHPGLPGGEPAERLHHEQRVAAGPGAGSPRPAPRGPRRPPARPPRRAGSGPTSQRRATPASTRSASAPSSARTVATTSSRAVPACRAT